MYGRILEIWARCSDESGEGDGMIEEGREGYDRGRERRNW